MKSFEGRVVKAVASRFGVECEKGVLTCFARKRLKLDGSICVGDRVKVTKDGDSFCIDGVLPRKNFLVRPYVSNIDVCLIVIACEPAPDLLLVDKEIVNCLSRQIEPVIVLNKTDIADMDLSEYDKVAKIFKCSAAQQEGIAALAEYIEGKTACLAGQSAVGKSSIVNAIADSQLMQVGELAKKIKRGKHTTRHVELISLPNGTYIADTCGFSMLDCVEMEPAELRLYFDDLEEFRPQCRFNMCTHTDEPDCAVRAHVGKEIGAGRYERYVALYNELVKRKQTKFD